MRSPGLAVAAVAIMSACYDPPVQSPPTQVTQETRIFITDRSKVDILFMVDNSYSMDAMQAELRARFGDFLSVFDELAGHQLYPDLHIGVVTSDFGAGDKPSARGCDASPGGQRGLLQALGAAAPTGCVAPVGAPYISYVYGPGGANNLPAGQSLQQTFTCMASVGSGGCGFEHQLESVHAALQNTVENAGFVRDDALLAVVFVTNEDDGSAPPTTTIYEDADGGAHGAYDTYRQTRYGIACGSPLAQPPYGPSGGPLDGCVPAPNTASLAVGEAYDVSRYLTLFTQPPLRGGIKRRSDDVILVGLDGSDLGFEVILAQNGSGAGVAPNPAYVPCGAMGPDCLVRLQHSCQNRIAPAFFADPGIRINTVVNAVPNHFVGSICGDDLDRAPDFSFSLTAIADQIRRGLLPGCISGELADPADPKCVVETVTTDDAGVDHITELLRCDLSGGSLPCWRVESKPICALDSPQSLGVTIDRGGATIPPDTTTRVFCATVAR
jgi:hypothetical protein